MVVMLRLEASRPRLVGLFVCMFVGLSVFKTRFAFNARGDISPQHKERKKQTKITKKERKAELSRATLKIPTDLSSKLP